MNNIPYPHIDLQRTGLFLKELKQQHHLKNQELVEYLCLSSDRVIYKWHSGQCLPSLDNFYALSKLYNNLMALIEKDYCRRNRSKVFEKVDYLIMSVGTSYEPLVLNISLFRPKRVLFLFTEKTEPILEKIVAHCQLSVCAYSKEQVEETNPLSIYRQIKDSYLAWQKPEKIYIDFTGGTKAMSVAAALAGALIEVQLVYVGTTNYLPDMRKPEPGSEELIYIDNPVSVFGDLEIEKAMVLFDQHNYTGAKEKLQHLMQTVPDPNTRAQLEFSWQVACAYESWDSLDFTQAQKYMGQLVNALRRDHVVHPHFLMMDFLGKFSAQNEILLNLTQINGRMKEEDFRRILSDKEILSSLIFSMYQNAAVRESQEKYDMAALLFYRQLEMIMQSRLVRYNLYASRMDYGDIRIPSGVKNPPKDLEDLKTRFADIKKTVFGRPGSRFLPDQISLLEGYILLLALDDDISKSPDGRNVELISRIRHMVYLRNNSIFAHGLGPVGKQNYEIFRNFVIDMLGKFCGLEGIPMKKCIDNVTWLNPMDSKYYSGMGS